jgi:hypothetical protein
MKHDTTAWRIQVKVWLQQTITKLQAEHPELLPRMQGTAQQQSSNAEKLYRVYQTHRNSKYYRSFCDISATSTKKEPTHNVANLNARPTHLLQR